MTAGPIYFAKTIRSFKPHFMKASLPFRGFSTIPPKVEASSMAPEVSAVTEPKKPMTFGRFALYAIGVLSGGTFGYYFYQAGGNLHTTEILISKKLAQLPFYYPPGPSQSERNSALPEVHLSSNLVDQISAWFIARDCALPEGLTREDVLTLCRDLGLTPTSETEASSEADTVLKKLTDRFIEKGRGRLTEHKRLSGVSLPETIQFMAELLELSQDTTIEAKLHAVLNEIIVSQNASANVSLVEEASDREMLEMELVQAERQRAQLASRALSEAEKDRLVECERNISELKQALA